MRLQIGRASQLIDDVLSDTSDGNMVYLSVMVPQAQKELVEGLAKLNRVKQAAVLRSIIDEWCESKQAVNESEAR